MKVTFVGVGEACDQTCPNTSILINSEGNKTVMLDCGFTVPHTYFNLEKNPEKLSCIWVSHFHGDHFFGVPLILLRFWEMGRKEPFLIIGPESVEKTIWKVMEIAYPGFFEKIQFPLSFSELQPGECIDAAGFSWQAAIVDHSCSALALRIADGQSSLFYSGDGKATQESVNLAEGCDLIIHESYRLKGETPGHSTVSISIDLAKRAGSDKLALVHIARNERELVKKELRNLQLSTPQIRLIVPDSGDEIDL